MLMENLRMYYTQIQSRSRKDMLFESHVRSYIRESILFEYKETQRVRQLNEGIFDFFSNLGDSLFKDVKTSIGKAVVDMLGIEAEGLGAKAVVKFFEKSGIKDIVNIVQGEKGCQDILFRFAETLIELIVKDIPNTLGLDPKSGFSKKLQTVFSEPATDMAKKVSEGLCALSWSDILSVVPGINMILKYLPGGEKEGEKVPDSVEPEEPEK